jgi:hypothetical protein
MEELQLINNQRKVVTPVVMNNGATPENIS